MAFLDNSGDIILDAVLTDEGRLRLARGDNSFKIAKFALGDDEINYASFRNSNHTEGAHASGSAYYDLEILQTPVFEAFTNNTSMMKSKLISVPRTNLLYLPVLKLNQQESATSQHSDSAFLVCVDQDTEENVLAKGSGTVPTGILRGFKPGADGGKGIRIDQGLNTNALTPTQGLDPDLYERQYIIEIDNRFASIVSTGMSGDPSFRGTSGQAAAKSFVDDDNVASYYLSLGTDPAFVQNNTNTESDDGTQVILGPRGSSVAFKFRASLNLQKSDYLFETLGSTGTVTAKDGSSVSIYFIDTTVRVSGATTGYRIDIPVRFIKEI